MISSQKDNVPNSLDSTASAYMANFENILAPGKEAVMTKEYKPQVACKFEKNLNPQTLKQLVLRSEKMSNIIAYYAQTTNIPKKKIERQAKEIIDEIGLERNLAIIRWCGMAITAIGKRITSGIYVNASNIGEVKQRLGHNPVLYLPSHRSYMDFILMSYICFYYDIEIPGIAAGMDFHSMFGMGTMLRKTGAFFMRRSFSNDEMYWDIFGEYIYALVASYHIGVEFFIEGTRSRNFKALVPKVGLLSMALLPYFTGEVPDVTIVPVSVSYERVLEEQLFVYELLGVPKPKESTTSFFKALKIIDERFGKMYLDFGAPISVREFFGHTCENRMTRAAAGTHIQKLNKHEIELVKSLAYEIVYQQQRRIVISTFNLLSLFFASQLYSQRPVHMEALIGGLSQLKCIFEELGAHVATDAKRIQIEIIETVGIHANIVNFYNAQLRFTQVAAAQLSAQIDTKRLKAHSLTSKTMAIAVPALSLQLYINPCLFWLARPAFLILAALQLQEEQKQSKTKKNMTPLVYNELLEQLSGRAAKLNDIFKHEFVIEGERDAAEFKTILSFLQAHDVFTLNSHSDEIVVNDNQIGRVILSALAPFICVYYQLALTLNGFACDAEFSQQEVLVSVQKSVEKQLLQLDEFSHVHPYCLALDNLNIALNAFVLDGFLERHKDTSLIRHVSGGKSLRQLEHNLLAYCQLMPFRQYFEVNMRAKL